MRISRAELEDFEQLCLLQKLYKESIGEEIEENYDFNRLRQAIINEEIEFYVVEENEELIGMCSICKVFSTFQYSFSGVFEDFYIKPELRNKGIARKLLSYAYEQSGVTSLTVGAADCDVDMYKALGFKIKIGNMLAWEC